MRVVSLFVCGLLSACSLVFTTTDHSVDADAASDDASASDSGMACEIIIFDEFDTGEIASFWYSEGLVNLDTDRVELISNDTNKYSELEAKSLLFESGISVTAVIGDYVMESNQGYAELVVQLRIGNGEGAYAIYVLGDEVHVNIESSAGVDTLCEPCMTLTDSRVSFRIRTQGETVFFEANRATVWEPLGEAARLDENRLKPGVSTFTEDGATAEARVDSILIESCTE